MLSEELEQSLNQIAQSASNRRHEFITVAHLLLVSLTWALYFLAFLTTTAAADSSGHSGSYYQSASTGSWSSTKK